MVGCPLREGEGEAIGQETWKQVADLGCSRSQEQNSCGFPDPMGIRVKHPRRIERSFHPSFLKCRLHTQMKQSCQGVHKRAHQQH